MRQQDRCLIDMLPATLLPETPRLFVSQSSHVGRGHFQNTSHLNPMNFVSGFRLLAFQDI